MAALLKVSCSVSCSPAALVVEEVDEEEFLCGPVLHPLAGSENVQWWKGKLHCAALARRLPRTGVHDLFRDHTNTEGAETE